MFQGYYNLASNLIVQNRNMNVISNNMTNISTPGFKSDQLVQGTFRDEILYRFERDGRTPIGTTSRINTAEGVATDQTQGTLRATERALDLALQLIQVMTDEQPAEYKLEPMASLFQE